MTLAPATPADRAALWELGHACFGENAWTQDNWRDVLGDPGHLVWTAREETGGLLGFEVFSLAGAEADLEWLAVRPDRRRQGIAARLHQAGMAAIRARGVGEIFLEVRSRNLPAREFYARHGFRAAGLRPAYYRNPPDDAVVMRCRCGEAAPFRP